MPLRIFFTIGCVEFYVKIKTTCSFVYTYQGLLPTKTGFLDMSAKTIQASELIELVPTGVGAVNGSQQSKFQKDAFGTFAANAFALPNIFTMNLSWDASSDIIVHEPEDLGHTIDFSFMIQGLISSDFREMRKELVLEASQHNFKFSPGKNIQHKMIKGTPLNVFTVSMGKDFFKGLIGSEDRWSEAILRKIEKQEPFTGGKSSLEVTPLMIHLIQSFNSAQNHGAIANLRRQSLLLELLATQLEQFKQVESAKGSGDISVHDAEKLHAIRTYIQQHFLEDLSLTGLSRISTLNEFKLKKGFRTLFNESVFGYVKQLRMEYASRLLRDDGKTIEEVAEILGYEYANHFSRAFKNHFGSNPSSLT